MIGHLERDSIKEELETVELSLSEWLKGCSERNEQPVSCSKLFQECLSGAGN